MKIFHIFAGGIISELSFIRISEEDTVVCADRGCKYAFELELKPDIIVGDFDSYVGELPDDCEIHRCPPEKDDTDTMLAVKLAIERGAEVIKIYGAFGGRIDHTLANIQTLKYAADHGCMAELCDCDNIVKLQQEGECSYPKKKDWYFSVFAYSEKVVISELSGVKYPLRNYTLTNGFPIGVSNEINDSEAILKIECGEALVVYSKM